MEDKVILRNEFVRVEVRDNCISFNDLTDKYNDTKGFTRGIRNLKLAVQFIKQIATDERLKDSIKFYNVVDVLNKFNLKPHTYCGMD